jgi:hypothetical protein
MSIRISPITHSLLAGAPPRRPDPYEAFVIYPLGRVVLVFLIIGWATARSAFGAGLKYDPSVLPLYLDPVGQSKRNALKQELKCLCRLRSYVSTTKPPRALLKTKSSEVRNCSISRRPLTIS